MTIQAVAWALEQHPDHLPRGPKLVLIALANHCDADGYCWLRLDTLAKESSTTERGVHRIISGLIRNGYVKKQPRRGADGKQRATDYWVLFGDHHQVWIGEPESDKNDAEDDTQDVVVPDLPDLPEQRKSSGDQTNNLQRESIGPPDASCAHKDSEEPSKTNLRGGRQSQPVVSPRSYAPKPQELDTGWYDRTSREARAVRTLCQIVGREGHFDNVMGGARTVYYPHEITPQLIALAEAPARREWVVLTGQQLPAWFGFAKKSLPNLRIKLDHGARAPWPWPPRKDGTIGTGPPDALADEDVAELKKTG